MPHSVTGSMSRPSSTSAQSASAFPRQAGVNLQVPETVQDQRSPSPSTFSVESTPLSIQSGSEKGPFVAETRNTRPMNLDALCEENPGDAGKPQSAQKTRRRTQYYEDSFAYKDDSTSSVRERVIKDAPIIADLRTNVIIKDEYTLVTDLSHHLSQRYQRPESSIMITVNHSACLLLGGSFEPTYVLTISGLPIQLQPTTNKRNAALITNFMFETIGVPADRALIKFTPIPEECLAMNGMTILGDIEKMERQYAEENGGMRRGKNSKASKSSKRSTVAKAKSSIQLSRKSSEGMGGAQAVSPPLPSPGPFDSGVAVNEKGDSNSLPLQPVDNMMSQKNSVKPSASQHLKDKLGSKATALPPPPPIPQDSPTPKVSKRKSLMAMFRTR